MPFYKASGIFVQERVYVGESCSMRCCSLNNNNKNESVRPQQPEGGCPFNSGEKSRRCISA